MEKELKFPGMELVTEIFGSWPSFHDGEIKWLKMDRADIDGGRGPTLEFVIHCWGMTNKVSSSGYFVLEKNTLVHFRFRKVTEMDFRDFNFQNAVFSVEIENKTNSNEEFFQITIYGANGLNGGFNAFSIEVLSAIPCDENGESVKNNFYVFPKRH